MPQAGDAVAEIEIEAPGQNGRTIPVLVDGAEQQHLTLFAGGDRFVYRIFLAEVPAGEHTLEAGGGAHPVSIRVQPDNSPELRHAPVLYARKNTIGRFTDVPMLCYSERLSENGRAYLQYTVIFSNEDGGTSTRGLMARWGRTTDIEYIYRVFLDTDEATIQAKDHKEVPFRGKRVGRHPFLIPSTDNNMVSDEGTSPIRYQMAPLIADLSRHSREEVMDEHPLTYRVAAEELEREHKLARLEKWTGKR